MSLEERVRSGMVTRAMSSAQIPVSHPSGVVGSPSGVPQPQVTRTALVR